VDESVYVIGDACIAGDMPKSGFAANSQAKVAAMNIRGDLIDSKVFPAKFANTCWSLIETDDNIKVGAQYAPGDGKIASTQVVSSARPVRMPRPARRTTRKRSAGMQASQPTCSADRGISLGVLKAGSKAGRGVDLRPAPCQRQGPMFRHCTIALASRWAALLRRMQCDGTGAHLMPACLIRRLAGALTLAAVLFATGPWRGQMTFWCSPPPA
jgi:hypothetical protein